MMQSLELWSAKLRDITWGMPLVTLLLGTGILLTILLRGLPVKSLILAISLAIRGDKTSDKQGVSAFSSLATELAATIGTGNVIGVVSAMLIGGPGALFWMNLSAVFGLSTKLVESSLSVKYRKKDSRGFPMGGPMITMQRAFPDRKVGKALAYVYAVLAILCCFGMGNAVQANSIAVSLGTAFGADRRKIGFLLALMILLAVLGGMKKIAKLSLWLVPAMGALYLAGCLGILLMNVKHLIPAISSIIVGAFSPSAINGGLFGTVTCTMLHSLRTGISRGVFSNEAGLGAAGISAAASKEEDYVKQGMISMTGVFFDTMVICTLTGLSFAVSGVMAKAESRRLMLSGGTEVCADDAYGMMAAAFEGIYGRYGGILLAVCLTLFAFATILGWAAQGEVVFRFLFGDGARGVFCTVYPVITFLGCLFSAKVAWNLSDVANGLLAVPNLICILTMAPGICEEIKNWKRV